MFRIIKLLNILPVKFELLNHLIFSMLCSGILICLIFCPLCSIINQINILYLLFEILICLIFFNIKRPERWARALDSYGFSGLADCAELTSEDIADLFVAGIGSDVVGIGVEHRETSRFHGEHRYLIYEVFGIVLSAVIIMRVYHV